MKKALHRLALTLEGRIQGVGFRPFVWRLAHELGLGGFVLNNSAGVRIEIQGSTEALEKFKQRLYAEQPPLAEIRSCSSESLPLMTGETDFRIAASENHSGQKVLVSPDTGTCADCLADIHDPDNQRFGYPFTNCVNCGPRYSITAAIPYDRINTVMNCFPLCENCASEYGNPADRRFHAQPIACPKCGPSIWLVDKSAPHTGPDYENAANALERAAQLLAQGKILALKGLGGFQLACDAANAASVENLRARKFRPHKAFAIMTANAQTARAIGEISSGSLELLESAARPIVLCPTKKNAPIASSVAPDSNETGIMLPNTPLHSLLFDALGRHGISALVMTSGNRHGEPICLGNREALAKLENIADAWLLHNRDILVRVDDSVTASEKPDGKASILYIRRARGYVPEAISLPHAGDQRCVLGAGAQLKATFCLTRENLAFVSQHLGDLDSPATMDFYEECLTHLKKLLECEPGAVAHDLHPDYLSTRLAQDMAEKLSIPAFAVQHHVAHGASVLAENSIFQDSLALCLDGTGLGTDGTIWGGELLRINLSDAAWERLGSLSGFSLPGGEMAIHQPWRIALALDPAWNIPDFLKRDAALLRKLIESGAAKNISSSCGRLFDAVAARLGLCHTISYEGQAAMRLMQSAGNALRAGFRPTPDPAPITRKNGLLLLESRKIFSACAQIHDKRGPEEAAANFHEMLAEGLARMCHLAARKTGLSIVGLSGGVLQNQILSEMLVNKIEKYGLQVLSHRKLPPGDGGLSLGQAVWARQLLNKAPKSRQDSRKTEFN